MPLKLPHKAACSALCVDSLIKMLPRRKKTCCQKSEDKNRTSLALSVVVVVIENINNTGINDVS